MIGQTNLNNHFLIATPRVDGFFRRAVVYVFLHDEQGAMGLVINHPLSKLSLTDVVLQMDIHMDGEIVSQDAVFLGGPVSPDKGFVLYEQSLSNPESSYYQSALRVSTSRDVLVDFLCDKKKPPFLVLLGCTVWSAEQLALELADNSWLTVPATSEVVFQTPIQKRWQAAGKLLGIDISSMVTDAGHG